MKLQEAIGKKPFWAIVVVVSILLIATPAMAGFATANYLKSNSSLTYGEVIGSEREEVVQEALNASEVKILMNKLSVDDCEVLEARAVKYESNKKQGKAALLKMNNSKDIQIVYTIFNGKVKTGAAVYQTTGDNQIIEVYDMNKGKMYHTSTVEIVNNEPVITWKDGPLVPSNQISKNIKQDKVTANWTNCQVCKGVCNALMAGGCGLTGWLACNLACAPFGTWTCPIICTVVFGILCSQGGSYSCSYLCADIGYCP